MPGALHTADEQEVSCNVQVVARFRPPPSSAHDGRRGAVAAIQLDAEARTVRMQSVGPPLDFSLDVVLSPACSQSDVYDDVARAKIEVL